MTRRLALAATVAAAQSLFALPALAQRATGIDVSAWQGTINWTSVANSGVDFTFIRSSRGGTTGTYNQSTQVGTISHRYDDPYFVSNITNATNKGILAGAYHYTRLDRIVASDPADPTYTGNTGLDEANHFLQQAGNYMRPGYLRPVVDVEGTNTSTKAVVTNFVLQFSDRIFAVTGVRPIVYLNVSYANDEVDSRLNTHDLWLARYTTAVDPMTSVDVGTVSGYPNVYGVWNPTYPTMPATRPWDFWQYSSTGATPGVSGNCDLDVANGDVEFVKEFLVPAMWTPDADGTWTTAANWNGVTVLPTVKDRTIVNRTAGNFLITLPSGTQSVRSLQMNERFNITGGSLAVAQYLNLANTTTLSAGTVTSATLTNSAAFTQSGGLLTTGIVTNTSSLAINGGTFRSTSIRGGSLAITDGNVELLGTGTSVVAALTTGGTGHLDIGTARFVVDYASGGTSPLESIRVGLLSGNIITTAGTSAVAVAAVKSTDLFTSFPATFGDVTVDSSSVLLLRALKGDATLNGTVDFDDLIKLAQSYNAAGGWMQGDFTYDGVIDFDDLIPLAQNYNKSLTGTSIVGGDAAAFSADWALAQSLVPEPTSLLLAAPLLVLWRTRRASDEKLD